MMGIISYAKLNVKLILGHEATNEHKSALIGTYKGTENPERRWKEGRVGSWPAGGLGAWLESKLRTYLESRRGLRKWPEYGGSEDIGEV